jgi:hypothetical protein
MEKARGVFSISIPQVSANQKQNRVGNGRQDSSAGEIPNHSHRNRFQRKSWRSVFPSETARMPPRPTVTVPANQKQNRVGNGRQDSSTGEIPNHSHRNRFRRKSWRPVFPSETARMPPRPTVTVPANQKFQRATCSNLYSSSSEVFRSQHRRDIFATQMNST